MKTFVVAIPGELLFSESKSSYEWLASREINGLRNFLFRRTWKKYYAVDAILARFLGQSQNQWESYEEKIDDKWSKNSQYCVARDVIVERDLNFFSKWSASFETFSISPSYSIC